MSQADFALEIEIHTEPRRVFDFLGDLGNFLPLHPLIESITEVTAPSDRPGVRRFEVVDRIPLGPFRFRTRYIAELKAVGDSEIHGHAWQFPRIEVVTVYRVRPIETGTLLCEHAAISAPLMLRRFVASQARDAHLETLAKLKRLLEGAD